MRQEANTLVKPFKTLLSLISVVAILFASTFSSQAICFDAENAYESVVVIFSGNALGSGYAITENCILTNAHVIDNEQSITVMTYSGSCYPASVIGINQDEDIAVLDVSEASFPYLIPGDFTALQTGDDIYAIGAPNGMAYTLTKGTVSAKERIIDHKAFIQIDAAINEGNSGGPLLNESGQLIGMNTLKLNHSEGIGFAIPITRILFYLDSLGMDEDPANLPDTIPDHASHTEEPDNSKHITDKTATLEDTSSCTNDLAWAITGVSIVGNISLTVLLIYEKKKNIILPNDPNERTDFEIELWE